jgi:hypothetical protein
MVSYSALYPEVAKLTQMLATHIVLSESDDLDAKEAAGALEPVIDSGLRHVAAFADAIQVPQDDGVRWDHARRR